MRSRAVLVLCTLAWLLALAPAALAAHGDGGEGLYGETPDKVVTNFGFIVIGFVPLFVLVMSLIQWRLEKRKAARLAAKKARGRGGW